MHAHEVVAVGLDGQRETIVEVPNQPSGLGWLPDGTMLVVSMVDRKLLRMGAKGLTEVADLSSLAPFHCNDMVVDAQGRAYIGNFGFDIYSGGAAEPRTTTLVMVTPDGEARAVAEDMAFPNGSVITPDGRTLIVAETMARRLTAFDIRPDGSLENRRVWAQLEVPPDGICLDADNCIWVAVPTRPGGFVRVAEGGKVLDRIDLEDRGGYACMLGGPDRRTLLLLEAFDGNPANIARGNGRLRTVEVETGGAGLP
ncbi:MAG TPA: SMP-30/gluconolactonase/LRE family protein [Dehalococcoidia bacterium]|nr:SMP-30/gluconolactonase/LRE family protein [Dehalococcoidia bacterium]